MLAPVGAIVPQKPDKGKQRTTFDPLGLGFVMCDLGNSHTCALVLHLLSIYTIYIDLIDTKQQNAPKIEFVFFFEDIIKQHVSTGG